MKRLQYLGIVGTMCALACNGGTAASESDSASATGMTSPTTSASSSTSGGSEGSASGSTSTGNTSGVSVSGTTTSGSTASTSEPTTSESTGATAGTSSDSDSDSDSDSSTGGDLYCSPDLRDVLSDGGVVVETCAADEGCAEGACVAACDSAAVAQANFGCTFVVPTPPAYPPALPPCFATFLTNTWGHPAPISVSRGGQELDISGAARLVTPGLDPKDWPMLPPEGIPADAVAVVFLSSDPKAVMPETQTPLTCPVPDAVGADTVIAGSGRSDAFVINAEIPVTAYDILPFGGAPSHFPSAELLFPASVWGTNYVALAPPPGTHNNPGPMWLQLVGLEDNTAVKMVPTTNLLQGPGLDGAVAGQLSEYSVGAGEVLQWQLPNGVGDPSGTLILSDKPVALHTGNRFLRLQPNPAPGGESTHQQNIAVDALGFSYIASPYETRRKDLAPEVVDYRFVGVVDGTTLTYDPELPGAPTTLDEGEVVDFASAEPFLVRSQDSSHPFALAQLMDTANLPGGTRPGATAMGYPPMLGDEEFVIVLPPAQFLDRYVFFTDPTYPTTNLVLTRAKKNGSFSPVNVDCLGEVGGWKPVGAGGLYEVTTVDLMRADVGVMGCENGLHTANSDGPFGLVVWGLDSYSSYAYPAGGSAAALSDVVVVPG